MIQSLNKTEEETWEWHTYLKIASINLKITRALSLTNTHNSILRKVFFL